MSIATVLGTRSELVKRGLLVAHGQKRGRYYVMSRDIGNIGNTAVAEIPEKARQRPGIEHGG